MNESYHTQHAPLGAFASFTVGLVDSPGGFGQSLRGPAQQNVYVGYRRDGERWKVLPFFKPTTSHASAFLGEAAGAVESTSTSPDSISPSDYRRQLGWASDSW